MKAILLCESNRATMINEPSKNMTPERLDQMIEEYEPGKSVTLYFVPVAGEGDEGWATFPEKYLQDTFSYDEEKISTEFVELSPKYPT